MDRFGFLGKEFLTWLWWRSERDNGKVGEIGVELGQQLVMVTGGNVVESATIASDAPSQAEEARTALRAGKKVQKARVLLDVGELQFTATITSDLALSSVKLPTVLGKDEDLSGTVLQERMRLLRQLEEIVHDLYRQFLDVRLTEAWQTEQDALRNWVLEGA